MENLEVGKRVFSRSRKRFGEIKRKTDDIYLEVSFGDEQLTLNKKDLIPFETDPITRLKNLLNNQGTLDDYDECILKSRAFSIDSKFKNGEFSSLISSKVQIYPHQISVVHRVCKEGCLRFLIADEVGLGKTIEAGLILKELKTLGLIKKILILVPADLVKQWMGELEKKFNEQFVRFDYFKEKTLLQEHPGINPWRQENQIICSIHFARDKERRKRIAEVHWDLVIVDEAHHLRRSEPRTTQAFYLGEEISQNCDFLLLLTATPLQLDKYEFLSLLYLLNPEISNIDEFTFHQRYIVPIVNEIVGILDRYKIDKASFKQIEGIFDKIKNLCGDIQMLTERYEDLKKSESSWAERINWEDFVHGDKKLTFQGVEFDLFRGSWFNDDRLKKYRENIVSTWNDIKKSVTTIKNREGLLNGKNEVKPVDIETLKEKFMELHLLSRMMCRNRRRPLFQSLTGMHFVRKAELIKLAFTEEEKIFYDEVTDYTRKGYHIASEKNDSARGFLMVIFQKILTSSTYALRKSLETRREKLQVALSSQIDDGNNKKNIVKEILEEVKSSSDIDRDMWKLSNLQVPSNKEEIEREIEVLNMLIDRAKSIERKKIDTKTKKLKELLKGIFHNSPEEKVLIFTQFLGTQEHLNRILSKNYSVILYNGQLKKEEKDKVIDKFKETAQIMISTEVGGEGRNFQFCHIMINYDLPWNPIKIEQRIGRLDRIGQEKDVEIYNFAIENTVEGRVVEILQERIKIFEETIGSLDPILGDFEEKIIELVMKQDKQRLEQWSNDVELKIRKAKETQKKLEDLVMDMQSFRRNIVNEIMSKHEQDKNTYKFVEEFLLDFLSRYHDSKISHFGNGIYEINLPGAFINDIQKNFNNDDLGYFYRIVFNPENAKDKEDIQFVSLGHPLFDYIVEYCKKPYFFRKLPEGECPLYFGQIGAIRLKNSEREIANKKGFLFNFNIKVLTPSWQKEMFLPVFIDVHDSKEDRWFAEKFLSMCSIQNTSPLEDEQLFKQYLPEIEKFRTIAENSLKEELEKKSRSWEKEFDHILSKRKERIETLYRKKISQEEKKLEILREKIEKLDRDGTEEEKKIIPALQGQIIQSDKRIKEYKDQEEQEMEKLNAAKNALVPSFDLINVIWIET